MPRPFSPPPNGHPPDARRRRDVVAVGRRLRELRHAKRLSLGQVSRPAGLSRGYLSQVERDRATPSTTALSRLSEVLGVTFVLGKGDSITLPSHQPHFWEALGRGVEALWVATPPSW